jgi:DMSO/TMAO reductase YedYZ molybdopterin-dependent catalytic subunit
MDAGMHELLDRARDLPPRSQTVRLRFRSGRVERTFKGPSLYDYAAGAGLLPPASEAGQDYYYLARGEDGFVATIAYAEVSPHFSDKLVMLASEVEGEPLQSGARLVVPGDDLAGRSISGLAALELRRAPARPAGAPDPGATIVTGRLDHPGPIDAAQLPQTDAVLPETNAGGVTVPAKPYAGVLLYQVLDRAGIQLDGAVREDFLRRIVVVRGVDGYTAVIAGGEIEPRFMDGHVLVATGAASGQIDAVDGPLRLVVPYDLATGRSVKRLTSIELLDG